MGQIFLSLVLLAISIIVFKYSTILACLAFAACCWTTANIKQWQEGEAIGVIILVVAIMVIIAGGKEILEWFN